MGFGDKMENQSASQPQSKRSSEISKQTTNNNNNTQIVKPNQVTTVLLYGIPIVCLFIEQQERLCLAQISNTLLKQFSYNEIHNRRVALGITCVQCTPVQLEILRRAGAMPVSSRRCGMITRREAERLCKSFLGDNAPPRLPDDFAFSVFHECAWGCRGSFLPSRYNSSRAKCIKCTYCGLFFSPNKFIFHSHRLGPNEKYVQPDAANFNSWRRHLKLFGNPPDEISFAWEDVKAMFNGGTRKRMISSPPRPNSISRAGTPIAPSPKRTKTENNEVPPILTTSPTATVPFPVRPIIHPIAAHSNNTPPRFPSDLHSIPFPRWMDYMWNAQTNQFNKPLPFPPYARFKWPLFGSVGGITPSESNNTSSANTSPTAASTAPMTDQVKPLQFYNHSAFKPVINSAIKLNALNGTSNETPNATYISDDEIEINNKSHEMELDENEIEAKRGMRTVIKESLSSDDEMVDIETTEDDIEDTRKELQRNCHDSFETRKRSVSPVLQYRESPTKIRCDYKKDQSPVKLHQGNKYDGNSNVTNASASISITATDLQHDSNSSPLSQHQLSPRSSSTSSPPINTNNNNNNNNHVTVPGELWSVAKLTLDRSNQQLNGTTTTHHQHHHIHHPSNRIVPFYRNDHQLNLSLNKHFHATSTAFGHIGNHHNNSHSNNNNNSGETTRQGHSHTIT
uniref:CSON005102 protein n=1 Tax=Culicoides sonorensis TaxID=179676 RepID=A0A336K8P3_CULSO